MKKEIGSVVTRLEQDSRNGLITGQSETIVDIKYLHETLWTSEFFELARSF